MNQLLICLLLCGQPSCEPSGSFYARSKVETMKHLPKINASLTQARRNDAPQRTIANLEETIKNIKSGKAFFAASYNSEPRIGDYGRFNNAIVFQVIDSDNALLQLDDESLVWVVVPTRGWSDLEITFRTSGVNKRGHTYTSFVPYKITGTKTYHTLLGKRTVPVAERLTDEERKTSKGKILQTNGDR